MTLSVVKDDRHRIACGCLVVGVIVFMVLVIMLLTGGFGAGARFFMPSVQQDVTAEFIAFSEKQRPDHRQLILLERQTTEKLVKTVNNTYKVPTVDGFEFNDSATVTIACPIAYNYYVDLKDVWKVFFKDGEMYVEAPLLRLDKPIVDVGRTRHEIQGSGQFFGEDRMLQEIARELSIRLYNNAIIPEQFNKYREPCRAALEEFISAWVTASGRQVKTLKIKFVDEKDAQIMLPAPRAIKIEKDSATVNQAPLPVAAASTETPAPAVAK